MVVRRPGRSVAAEGNGPVFWQPPFLAIIATERDYLRGEATAVLISRREAKSLGHCSLFFPHHPKTKPGWRSRQNG